MFKEIKNKKLSIGSLIMTSLSCSESRYELLVGDNKSLSWYKKEDGSYDYYLHSMTTPTPCLLIDNPDEYEKEVKSNLELAYKAVMEEDMRKKASKKSLSQTRGDILLDDSGSEYLYLGKIRLKEAISGEIFLEGHGYKRLSSHLEACDFYNNGVCIECGDGSYYGSVMHGSYLNMYKSKSKRFYKSTGHIDVSSLNNKVLKIPYYRNPSYPCDFILEFI